MPTAVENVSVVASLGGPASVSLGRMLQAVADVLGGNVRVLRRLRGTYGFTFIVVGETAQQSLTRLRPRVSDVLNKLTPIDRDLMLGFILYRDAREGFNEVACAPGPNLTPRYGQSLGYDNPSQTPPLMLDSVPLGGPSMMSGPGPGVVFGPQIKA
jgi:hypothetical protein